MEILHKFGIDPALLIAQIINFAIVLFILKRYLYKPILSMLKTRENEIKKGLADSEKARLLLEETSLKEKKILKAAQLEAKKELDEARKRADRVVDEAKAETRKQAELMLKEAKEQITFESRQAEKRLTGYVSRLAVELLEKSLPQVLTEQERTSVLKQAIKKMKGEAN